VKALGQSRPGVVLCGGGGKGAYQIGSILALFDLGITDFSGIAGTSVGGLNAVLLHRLVTELTEGREKRRSNALQIWSSISRSKVFGGSWGMALKLVLFFFYVVLRAVPTIMNILQDDEHRFWSLIENACVKTASWRGAFSSNRAKNLIRLLATVLTSSLQLTLYAGSLLFIIIPFLDNARIKNFFGVFIQACFGSRPVAGLVLLLIGFALCIIGAVVWSRLNVFSFGLGLNTKPLAYSIKSALDGWSPSARQLPVYCTLASWEYRRISTMGAKRVSITGSWKKVYSPFYMPVDLADKEFAERMLLSTTALPFVFAGPDAKAGFVDGGVVDNTPIAALSPHKPKCVLIVFLNHQALRNDSLLRHDIRKQLLRQQELEGRRRELEPDVERWISSVQFLRIVPSRNIGGLIWGTMNFSTSKARRLIYLGYTDTLRQLRYQSDAGILNWV
jgi:hypothetical protein